MCKYSLKIIDNKNNIKEEYYNELSEAMRDFDKHTSMIEEYIKYVALINVNDNNVLRLLRYENDANCYVFYDGDIVKIKGAYSEKGEEKYLYVISNMNENNGHCLITCINSGMPIPSSENVDIEMLDLVAHVGK